MIITTPQEQKSVKRFMGVLFVLMLSGCSTVQHFFDEDKSHWLGTDKVAHVLFSGVLGALAAKKALASGQSDCESMATGVTFVVFIGAGKETVDKEILGRPWSPKDMVANVVGGTVGSMAASGCH